MVKPIMMVTGATAKTGREVVGEGCATETAKTGRIPSSAGWFAAGERVGYDPKARTIVTAGDPPLRIFLRHEGDLAQAVSFLPGFPDGSFGWAPEPPTSCEICR